MNENRNQILEAGLRGEELLLKGIVVPGDTDKRLAMVSIVLSTDQELDFMIERDAKGDELFDHLRELVRGKGFIREDGKGRRMIRITDYEVLENIGKINKNMARVKLGTDNFEEDLAIEIAKIANNSIHLANRCYSENRIPTKDEALRQIAMSVSLLRAIIKSTNK